MATITQQPPDFSERAMAAATRGDFAEAESICRRGIDASSGALRARLLLAALCDRQGRPADAVRALESAADPESDHLRGTFLLRLGRFEEAVEAFDRALVELLHSATTHFYRGVALFSLGRFVEAAAAYDAAVYLQPAMFEAHNNLGLALQKLGKLDGALSCHDRATGINPTAAEPHNCRGNCLIAMGRVDDAGDAFERCLALDPDHPHANNNAAILLHRANRHPEALERYERAIDSAKARGVQFEDAIYNRGLLLLTLGDFRRGWADYEHRIVALGKFQLTAMPGRSILESIPTPAPARRARIYVRAEQGYGDTLQFARYLPMLCEAGAHVTFECQPGLGALLRASDLCDAVVERDERNSPLREPEGALSTFVQSLPSLFRTDFSNIPASVPYLKAPEDRLRVWRDRIDAVAPRSSDTLRIGIVWAGNQTDPYNRHRSCSLAEFAPLASVEGARFFSLQKGPRSSDALTPPAGMSLVSLGADFADFADTAAAVEQMDLIVTVDTSMAHLAGALGKPTWTLLMWNSDWRWFLDRSDSPWYPSMRLFRQPSPGAWPETFAAVAEALSELRLS